MVDCPRGNFRRNYNFHGKQFLKMPMLNIYLADLANDFIDLDNKSVPIGIGYVGAYCKQRFKDDVNVAPFRTLKQLLEKIKEAPPDIVGFSSYDWNYNLSLNAAFLIKKDFPKCMIVLGGANVASSPENNRELLCANPCIDFLVYGDGEFSFSHLVQLLIQYQSDKDPVSMIKSLKIDGVRSLNGDSLQMGQALDFVMDLSLLPSPFLTGFLDDLLQNPLLMPIIQNVRGCPYECSFCVSGTQSAKLRQFPLERVTKEIDYLRDKSLNRVLRFSDDNFGIMKGDLYVAEYIRKSYETYKYPSGIKLYLSKKMNQSTCDIANILKKLTLMNISFQSVTPNVLENSKRVNLSLDEVSKSMEFARKNGIATGTELIFGLPGESIASMQEVTNKMIEFRFDSISLGVLWLLRGTELSTPEMRQKYKYTGKFMLGENAISRINGLISIEADEIAVASDSYTFEEWQIFIQYLFIFEFVISFGYGRELLYHALNFDIQSSDFFRELIDNPEKYSVISEISKKFKDKYLGNLYDSEEELYNFIKQNIDKFANNKEDITSLSKIRIRYNFFEKILFDDPGFSVFSELSHAIINLYKGEKTALFKELTEQLKELTVKLIINPKIEYEEEIPFVSEYDVKAWISDGYFNPLSDYVLAKPKEFSLRPRNPEVIKYIISKESKNSCFDFFRYTLSSDRRRLVTSKT